LRRFLLPLLVALALPTAVNAESFWLYVVGKRKGWSELVSEKFPMVSLEACEKEAQIIKEKGGNFSLTNSNTTFPFPNNIKPKTFCINGSR
jgi:hypothetical protein